MISMELARRLRDAGLIWRPADGDRFVVPDRDLDQWVYSVSEVTAAIRSVPGGEMLAFTGTAEWALDSIMQGEVVWLPTEEQLRTLLGAAFRALRRTSDGYRCELDTSAGAVSFDASVAADSYGLALLSQLERVRA